MQKAINTKSITVMGIMSAIGFILMILEFPLPFIIPGFIKFDFSELPALITAFALGPVQGIVVCFVKNLLHLFITTTAGVGELSNFILGAIFVGSAGLIYKYKKTRTGALIGSVSGAILMAVIGIATNYFITYPFYTNFMPMEAIIGAYQALLPSCNSLLKCLVIFNLPFNFAKGIIDAVICFMIYKKLSPILKTKQNNHT
ncbi:MAG: ECF transporter S component [Ruminococcaceae bacterium]|nr:ECF transporter S component [Oscillospiraceae bacterium]